MYQLLRHSLKSFAVAAVLLVLIATRSVSVGDATSREGCMNQWLFNGIWRVQVTAVAPYLNGGSQTGWQVTEVWRNGTTQELAPGDSLLQDQKLELNSGSILASASSTGSLSNSVIASHGLPAAGQFTYTQVFVAAGVDPTNKPKAIDILFDAAKLATFRLKPHFTTHQYNFHFKLDCTASGAAAQAEGGSMQIAGTEGCMNQWMSNRVWRVRVTAIGPDNDDNGAAGPQIGWMITEDWISLVNRPIAPGDTNVTDQQIVLASGDTVASSNSAGTSMNMSQLLYRTFPVGGSYTHQQRFRQANLDPSNKPVKLLVTFDATAEKKNPHAPQYSNPPNFRISLTCTK